MKYGGKYWNIKKYLPYQRCFNFINSERTIGKTYTTQGFFTDRGINRHEESIYIIRTQDEKKDGVLPKAFLKVLTNEFSDIVFNYNNDFISFKNDNDEWQPLFHAIALTEVNKMKRVNYPNVKWGLFDEYILDETGKARYIDGWDEPELVMKMYHTIDREQDNLILFFLANNISFYNPYHIYKAFQIPPQEKEVIWKSENVLYHWTEATQELKEEKSKCKFLKMIEGTKYGGYAAEGRFINDNMSFIENIPKRARYMFTVKYRGKLYGIWFDGSLCFISDKIEKSARGMYALSMEDHNENMTMMLTKNSNTIKWFKQYLKLGKIRYTSMGVKVRFEELLYLI
jgi:hypothetical protein